jgi:hypothetical protein
MSLSDFKCGVNIKAGALFKRLQQHNSVSKGFQRRNHHLAENKGPALFKNTYHSKIGVVIPSKAVRPVRSNIGLQALKQVYKEPTLDLFVRYCLAQTSFFFTVNSSDVFIAGML